MRANVQNYFEINLNGKVFSFSGKMGKIFATIALAKGKGVPKAVLSAEAESTLVATAGFLQKIRNQLTEFSLGSTIVANIASRNRGYRLNLDKIQYLQIDEYCLSPDRKSYSANTILTLGENSGLCAPTDVIEIGPLKLEGEFVSVNGQRIDLTPKLSTTFRRLAEAKGKTVTDNSFINLGLVANITHLKVNISNIKSKFIEAGFTADVIKRDRAHGEQHKAGYAVNIGALPN